MDKKGPEALHAELIKVDKEWADKVKPTDSQRIVRGLCVYKASGKPISYWISRPKEGRLPFDNFLSIGIAWPREELVDRITRRFDIMLDDGLEEEARALYNKGYSPELPALKSLGIREFYAYFEGRMTREDAAKAMLTQHTRYAKRQMTWLRNSFKADLIIGNPAEVNIDEILNF